MSARAETFQFQGGGRGHRTQWYAVVGAIAVAAIVAVTLIVMSSSSTTAPDRVARVTHQQSTDTSGPAIAPSTNVRQVGGTSPYRYHPLPGVNAGFDMVEPPAAGGTSHGSVNPYVGGGGAYQFHPLP